MTSRFSLGLPRFFVAAGAECYGPAMYDFARQGKRIIIGFAAAAMLLSSLLWAAPAVAGYEEGLAARQRGDFAAAIREWAAAADAGDARAQFGLGAMYRNGEGLALDAGQAAALYRKAAQQGHVQAQFSLGVLYQNGVGVAKDDAIAATWYTQAARQSHAQAQYNLAVMYQLGAGVKQDLVEAFAWLTLAALQEQTGATGALGRVLAQLTPEQRTAAEKKAEQYGAEAKRPN